MREIRGKIMKKVFFVISVLVMLVGFVFVEVVVLGDGCMGVIYDGNDV